MESDIKYTMKASQRRFHCLFAVVFILNFGFFTSTDLFGQNIPDTNGAYLLNEVIVTAQYAPQPLQKSVFNVKVINSKTIEARGANNLRELLYLETHFELENKSVFGSSLEIQGAAKENVKFLVDGVPVIGRLNGIIDLMQLPLTNIERVEIIQGPVSVYYGTDALAGVINIITKKTQPGTWNGTLNSYYESVGQFNLNGFAGFSKKNHIVQISGGRNYFDGQAILDTIRAKEWESREQYFGKLMYSYLWKNIRINNTSNYFIEELIKLGNPNSSNKALDMYYNTQRWNNDLSISGNLPKNRYFDAVFSYSDYKRWNDGYSVDLTNNTQELSATASNHDTTWFNQYFFRGQYSKKDTSKFSYMVGYNVSLESTEGQRILDREQKLGDYAVFGSATYSLFSKLSVQAGARYTYNTGFTFKMPVSPNVIVRWDIGKHADIKASYAMGYRAPSLKELYMDYYAVSGPNVYHIHGNTDLEAERSHNYNLSYNQRFNIGKTQKLATSLLFFYNDISNMITLSDLVNFERYYININQHQSYGAQVDVSYEPIKNVRINTGFLYRERYNALSEDYSITKFLPFYAFTSNATWTIEKYKASLTVSYKYNGERNGFMVVSNQIKETYVADYQLLDVNVSKSLCKDLVKVSAGAKNLLDVKNLQTVGAESGQVHVSDLAFWGRTYYVSLALNFGKKEEKNKAL